MTGQEERDPLAREARAGVGLMLSGARLLCALARRQQKPQIGGRMRGKSTASSSGQFHLAYYSGNTLFFMSGKPTQESLRYALVPAGLAKGPGPWNLETISLLGRPGEKIVAFPTYLRSLRQADIPNGICDGSEERLLDILTGRAIGAAHVLPPLLATTEMPWWSKLVLPSAVLSELQRLGGVA